MINTLVLSLFLSFVQVQSDKSDAKEIRWTSIEQAMNKTAQNPKLIVIDFYTDWCGWCKKLDQTTYIDAAVVEYMNAHYYTVKFDAEQKEDITFLGKTYSFVPSGSRGTHQFAATMANRNGRIGYPTITFLDENGNKIAVEAGYKDPVKMLNLLKYYAEGFYKEINFNEYLSKQAPNNSSN